MQAKNNLILGDKISLLKGVGTQTLRILNNLNIFTIEDLLRYLPRRYVDARNVQEVEAAKNNLDEYAIIKATVLSIQTKSLFRRRRSVTNALLQDKSDQIECVWFNRPYMDKSYGGKTLFLYGKFTKNKFTGRTYIDNPIVLPAGGIYPIYRKSEALTDTMLRKYLKEALCAIISADELDEIARVNNLLNLEQALNSIHFPKNFSDYRKAKNRFDFEGLTKYIVAGKLIIEKIEQKKSIKLESKLAVEDFIASLPYKLTKDQQTTIDELSVDLRSETPANRIIIGDVGVGKTVVAAAACVNAIASGSRVVWLAPTEILANQHYELMSKIAKKFIKKITLLTSSNRNKADLQSDLIIATHAAIYSSEKIKNLGLVIVDEQHRFGVAQREKLLKDRESYPHFISMTATPIPRTIAHLIFGSLDISFIRTKPKNRKPVKTYFVKGEKIIASYKFVSSLISKGQQVFIICPLIEEDESGELSSIKSELKKIRQSPLGKFKIKTLHGKMKSNDKNDILNSFAKGEFDILISTTVIEVGIDIADATVVIIENAERFGLAQLHQIRGRVGRRDLESFCLIYSNNLNTNTVKRLKTFCQNNDGFKLAESDLRQRGPGSLLGFEQSGFANFDFSWLEDEELLKISNDAAREIMSYKSKFKKLIIKANDLLLSEHLE